MTVKELGCVGHFIAGDACRWRRHTQITLADGTGYRVSTVGDYFPSGAKERDTVGYHRFFESMVFRTKAAPDAGNEGCGCAEVESYSELDVAGYQTAGEAQAGHEAMVVKWREIASDLDAVVSSYAGGVR